MVRRIEPSQATRSRRRAFDARGERQILRAACASEGLELSVLRQGSRARYETHALPGVPGVMHELGSRLAGSGVRLQSRRVVAQEELGDEFAAALNADLREDCFDVVLHRVRRDVEAFGDLAR